MEKRMLHWQRYNLDETGFNYVEIYEDGEVRDRRFKKRHDKPYLYDEVETDTTQVDANILIEKLSIPQEGKITESEVQSCLETVERFPASEWASAREMVERLQSESQQDLRVDYHSLLEFDRQALPEALRKEVERTKLPIVPFRVEHQDGIFVRKEEPERLSIRFVPELNERLYFYLHAREKHLSTTGDRLFALHTQQCEEGFCEADFESYVEDMVRAFTEDPERYHDLIVKQRNRRAMIDTDEIGDLYPR